MSTDSIGIRPSSSRKEFTNSLYLLYFKLNSGNDHLVSDARRVLAALRRSLTGPEQASAAYQLVFDAKPAEKDEEAFLLVGGLFGIHPQPRMSSAYKARRTLGAAMRSLNAEKYGTADRRFEQLLGMNRRNLPHYLRQTVRLLSTKKVSLDYGLLLDDVIVLLGERTDEAERRRVRLAWARDYHRRPSNTADGESDESPAGEPTTDSSDTEN
ncbi:type I-E CRISPR-associated protein Cse2/CasB [Actinoalloteichus hymeniacidonis]|uniref:CRISPR type I-E/ECOLI-associated protein CasB/Cse2 n=1 Tax=Actinoalloteichus hymeniacidonis TaxID=340345 RepID=A0AAC9HSS4_9PSEU|nr:type I-E CRISPR-associated protein Cse2/CasB [Actinoalloteichus hymeniacidonis]AOS64803.1 CRISPR type I-E/ECOLI-associated protein CasB/Cse2 [Actinoalloteichus hymeniacidonis]MBB5907123.1 CRISPR system Cascade subunit CasB [Actinoalloteichus hymeniacidonis]